MQFMSMILLMAGGGAGGAQGAEGGAGGLLGFLPFILIFLVLYLLMIRPQAKKQKQHQKMLQEIKQGDHIVTIGGIHGSVAGIREKDNVIIVKVGDSTKLEMDRSAIGRVIRES